MSESIEVLFHQRVGPYNKGGLYVLQDNVFLRAVIKSGKADVVNPPDWTPEKADSKKPTIPVVPKTVKAPKEELDKIKVVSDGDEDTGKSAEVESVSKKLEGNRRGSNQKSEQRSEENEADSSEGFGGSGEFFIGKKVSEVQQGDSDDPGSVE